MTHSNDDVFQGKEISDEIQTPADIYTRFQHKDVRPKSILKSVMGPQGDGPKFVEPTETAAVKTSTMLDVNDKTAKKLSHIAMLS